ncbi:MAG: hypothetical protein IT203_00800 [Fimbriimonadaceae bacterium]|nr:hypothetical protein [Fimbriimonadaceae bacterium]
MLGIARGLVWIVCGAAVVAALIIGFRLFDPNSMTPVPNGRDERLTGDWYVERFGIQRHYVFEPNGTGEIWSEGVLSRKFTWGTYGDEFVMKFRGNDVWQVNSYHFQLQQGGKDLNLEADRNSNGFSFKMHRAAPVNARIP